VSSMSMNVVFKIISYIIQKELVLLEKQKVVCGNVVSQRC
jgi:hypothetical protein